MSTGAVLEALRKVPPGVIERNLAVASDRLVGGRPKPHQLEACVNILRGKDVLVNLPTGYGKTLIYQLLPIAAKEILRETCLEVLKTDLDPFVLVLSPLISLMEDQVKRCDRLGLTALYLIPSTCQSTALEGKAPDIIYSSPEMLLKSRRGRELMLSRKVQMNIIAVIIDEAHCIVKW